MRERKDAKKKQRRDKPTRFDIFAAALYWLARLILMLWDRWNR